MLSRNKLKHQLHEALFKDPDTLITKQRIAIIESISDMDDIRIMEDVWIHICKTHRVSQASVYNAIRVWVNED